jgi:predicted permease
MDLARAFYRCLLWAFPAELRRRRGDAMTELFVVQSAAAPSAAARLRLWLLAIGDAGRYGVGARWPEGQRFSWRAFMDHLVSDIRFTLASARRSKGFFSAAVLTFALGIGATTAMMSVANAVLLKPLPYPASGDLVQVWEEHPGAPPVPGYPPVANSTYYAWKTHLGSLEDLGMFGGRDYTVRLGDDSIRVHGGEVSPSIFGILRVTPQLGRFFTPADDVPGHHDFVVLSDRFWRERFAASPAVLGQTVTVDARPHVIVGVARPGLEFPDKDVLMWTPFDDPTLVDPTTQGGVWLANVLARRVPGASLRTIEEEGTTVARSIPRAPVMTELLGQGGEVVIKARTLGDLTTSAVRPALVLLVAGVVLVLLVGCANVANLLLARGVARERELLLRTAIGASRGRLVRQLLTESLVLAGAGGAGGLLLAWALLRLAAVSATSVPRIASVGVDAPTVAIAIALTAAVALIAGLLPALRGARVDVASGLRGADGAVAGGFRGQRAHTLRRALLAGETALAVLLLVGAGLMGRSFLALMRVDPGYTASGVLGAKVFAPDAATPERIGQFMYGLMERLEADGRVQMAGAGNMMPFNDSTTVTGFDIPAHVGNGRDVRTRVVFYIVTPGYAETLGLRLKAGRLLTRADREAEIAKVVVNEEFVREYLSPDRVIGLQLPPRRAGTPPMEIVGVVAAQRKDGNDKPVLPEMYMIASAAPRIGTEVDVLVRTAGDPAALAPVLRDAVRQLDPEMVVGETATLERRLGDSVSQPRVAAAVLTGFAAAALVLAAIGVYGVLSYSVSQRTRELAVRSALGADRRRLLLMVVGEGLTVTAAGAAAGLVASALLTRLMTSVLFGVAPLDLVSFATAPLALLPVVVLACLIPAMAASRASAATALRS